MSIKAICFDLDGVYFTPAGKQSFYHALSDDFGTDPKKVNLFMGKGHPAVQDLVRGNITNEDFFDTMRKYLEITQTDEEITSRWIQDYEIDEQVRQTVLYVKKQGYLTCVCTNNNDIRLSVLEKQFNFFKDFDAVVSSHMVGECKPSETIYQALLDKMSIEPSELVYADDNPDRIQAAINLGITAFVFVSFDQFLRDLKSLGIDL